MWKITAGLLMSLLSAAHLLHADSQPLAEDTSAMDVEEASHRFSVNLIKVLLSQQQGNLVVSPISVSTALAILQQGARGESAVQLQRLLHLDQESSRKGFARIIQDLQKRESKSSLEFGNAMFLDRVFNLQPKFKTDLSDFRADIEHVDFRRKESAAREVNSWVSRVTKNRIPQLITPDAISERPMMLLVNAIFFKGVWLYTFNKNRTTMELFGVQPGLQNAVPMMNQIGFFRAGEEQSINAKWLELPFDGGEYSMLLVLPNEKFMLDSVISKLSPAILDSMLNTKSKKRVILGLPRFKLNTAMSLVPALRKLGLEDVFTSKSDLQGISNRSRLLVSDVIHKAEMEVNEEGSTASAATGILVNTLSLGSYSEDVIFLANHPFLVFIMDNVNKVPLFAGRVLHPTG